MKDRIAQAAVKRRIEPIFEKIFCDCSYGFRPGRSQMNAINKVEEYKEEGYNINHELLMEFITGRINDGWVLRMIKSWLTAGVMTEEGYISSDQGTPQGGVISPLLANIYFH